MPRKPRKPAKLVVGPIRARAIRGPHKDGSGRWYWRAEQHQSSKTKTIWTGWATRKDASQHLAAIVAAGPEQPTPAPQVEGEACIVVRDLLECWVAYIQERGDLAAYTVAIYQGAARRMLRPLGSVRLAQLSKRTLEQFRDQALRSGRATSTVHLDLRVFGLAWRWGRELGIVPDREQAIPSVKIRPSPKRSRYTPTRAEILQVLDAADGWKRIALLLLYATGARPGEIARLTWGDIDLERGLVYLGRHKGSRKTGERIAPLHPDVIAELRQWGPGQGRVLLRSPETVRSGHWLPPLIKAAGVQRWTLYGLRRAAVDAMIRAGVDVATAASITGHSIKVMLQFYRKVTEDDRRAAVLKAGLGALPRGEAVAFEPREDRQTGTI